MNKKAYELFIFDLDGTLIDERSYVLPRFEHYLKESLNESDLQKEIIDFFNMRFPKRRRGIIQAINLKFKLKLDIELYKHYLRTEKIRHNLTIINNSAEHLNYLYKIKKKIWICTNGNLQQQQNKIFSFQQFLGFKPDVYYCALGSMKPSPRPVKEIMKVSETHACKSIFIGDSKTDRIASNLAGVKFQHQHNYFNRKLD